MCGIFGISGHPDAAAMTHLGLYSLQHRGQESAGIVSTNRAGEVHGNRRWCGSRAAISCSRTMAT